MLQIADINKNYHKQSISYGHFISISSDVNPLCTNIPSNLGLKD